MNTAQIPQFNKSLKAFSSVIQVCAILGSVSLFIGIIWMTNALGVGDWSAIGFTLSLAYGGAGLIGLAIAGAFLRHTAKVIVEGLGGTIDIENPTENFAAASAEGLAVNNLTVGQYDAWVSKGMPDLANFKGSTPDEFHAWLEQNKR